ncbi:phage regulatory CII family protein [Grimontia sp. SpTr1]|uniref:phage regulatory CII family protein n=1 Tax=Grimontia sp. SpTr1 TaxID=2995319 RepID=UPI00248A96CD|nr:phage regulatory CII family protein [Grimontia sp. SpTr1]
MDHLDTAVYSTVHDSPIPARQIAQQLGMSHQVLINKANPQSDSHKLSLREALAVQLITGNYRILEAMTTELDLHKAEEQRTASLLESVLKATAEHGDVVKVIQDALEDGVFSLREREKCQQEVDEAIKALETLRKAIVVEPLRRVSHG